MRRKLQFLLAYMAVVMSLFSTNVAEANIAETENYKVPISVSSGFTASSPDVGEDIDISISNYNTNDVLPVGENVQFVLSVDDDQQVYSNLESIDWVAETEGGVEISSEDASNIAKFTVNFANDGIYKIKARMNLSADLSRTKVTSIDKELTVTVGVILADEANQGNINIAASDANNVDLNKEITFGIETDPVSTKSVISTYDWSIDEIQGVTSSTEKLNYTFDTPGEYTVRVTITGDNAENTAELTYTVIVGSQSKEDQTITFNAIADQIVGNVVDLSGVVATSGLDVAFAVSPSSAGTINGTDLTINETGSITVTASQSGDDSYNAATDVEQTFMAYPSLQIANNDNEIFIESNEGNQVEVGTTVVFTLGREDDQLIATVAPTYDWSVDNLSDESQAEKLVVEFDTEGVYVITLDLAGQPNGTNTTSLTYTITVGSPAKEDQTITFDAIADQIVGNVVDLSGVVATSGLDVAFTVSPSSAGTINGTDLTINEAGSITVTASQSGNDSYNEATDVEQTFMAYPSLQIANDNNEIYIESDKGNQVDAGTTVTFTLGRNDDQLIATVAPTYDWSVDKLADASQNDKLVVDFDTEGVYVITLDLAGEPNGTNITSLTYTITVGSPAKEDQTITFDAIADQIVGNVVDLSGVVATSGLDVAFTVSPSSAGTINGTDLTINEAGSITVTASQSGNDSYNAATDVEQTFMAYPSLQIANDNNEIYIESDKGNQVDVGTTVVFTLGRDDDQLIATVNPTYDWSVDKLADASQNDKLVVDFDTEGIYVITLDLAGEPNATNTTSLTYTITVGSPAKEDQTITFDAIADQIVGNVVDLSGVVATSGLDVTFTVSPSSAATINGTDLTINEAGSITVTASQSGNDSYNAATDVEQTFMAYPSLQIANDNNEIYIESDKGNQVDVGTTVVFTLGRDDDQLIATVAPTYDWSVDKLADASQNDKLVVDFDTEGVYVITLDLAGEPNGANTTSLTYTITVGSAEKEDQVLTFTEIVTMTVGDTETLEVSSDKGLTDFTFTMDPAGLATITGNSITADAAGTLRVTANQAGDDNTNPATASIEIKIYDQIDDSDITVTIPDVINEGDDDATIVVDVTDEVDDVTDITVKITDEDGNTTTITVDQPFDFPTSVTIPTDVTDNPGDITIVVEVTGNDDETITKTVDTTVVPTLTEDDITVNIDPSTVVEDTDFTLTSTVSVDVVVETTTWIIKDSEGTSIATSSDTPWTVIGGVDIPGDYTVEVTVVTEDGQTVTKITDLTVNPKAKEDQTVTLTISDVELIKVVGEELEYTAISDAADQTDIDVVLEIASSNPAGVASIAQDGTVTFNEEGTVTFKATEDGSDMYNSAESDEITVTVVPHIAPYGEITFADADQDGEIELNEKVTFTFTNEDVIDAILSGEYSWWVEKDGQQVPGDDKVSSLDKLPTNGFDEYGTYTVYVTTYAQPSTSLDGTRNVHTYEFTFTIADPGKQDVVSLTLDIDNPTEMYVGQVITLTSTIDPAILSDDVEYAASDVNSNALVSIAGDQLTAVAEGTADVQAQLRGHADYNDVTSETKQIVIYPMISEDNGDISLDIPAEKIAETDFQIEVILSNEVKNVTSRTWTITQDGTEVISGTDFPIDLNLPAGTYTVTATVEANAGQTISVSEDFDVTKLTQEIIALDSHDKMVGDDDFNLEATTNPDVVVTGSTITYLSNDENIVTVDDLGNVTIVGVGSTTITVTASETDMYESATKEITINVTTDGTKEPQVITISDLDLTMTVGDVEDIFTVLSDKGLTDFTYELDVDGIVALDEAKPSITAVAKGTVVLTVSEPGNDEVEAGTASVTIKVYNTIDDSDITVTVPDVITEGDDDATVVIDATDDVEDVTEITVTITDEDGNTTVITVDEPFDFPVTVTIPTDVTDNPGDVTIVVDVTGNDDTTVTKTVDTTIYPELTDDEITIVTDPEVVVEDTEFDATVVISDSEVEIDEDATSWTITDDATQTVVATGTGVTWTDVVLDDAGVYDITVTVTTVDGQTVSTTKTINVEVFGQLTDKKVRIVTDKDPEPVVVGDEVTFSVEILTDDINSDEITVNNWNVTDNYGNDLGIMSDDATLTHTFDEEGVVIVWADVTKESTTVRIFRAINIGGDAVVVEPLILDIKGNESTAVSVNEKFSAVWVSIPEAIDVQDITLEWVVKDENNNQVGDTFVSQVTRDAASLDFETAFDMVGVYTIYLTAKNPEGEVSNVQVHRVEVFEKIENAEFNLTVFGSDFAVGGDIDSQVEIMTDLANVTDIKWEIFQDGDSYIASQESIENAVEDFTFAPLEKGVYEVRATIFGHGNSEPVVLSEIIEVMKDGNGSSDRLPIADIKIGESDELSYVKRGSTVDFLNNSVGTYDEVKWTVTVEGEEVYTSDDMESIDYTFEENGFVQVVLEIFSETIPDNERRIDVVNFIVNETGTSTGGNGTNLIVVFGKYEGDVKTGVDTRFGMSSTSKPKTVTWVITDVDGEVIKEEQQLSDEQGSLNGNDLVHKFDSVGTYIVNVRVTFDGVAGEFSAIEPWVVQVDQGIVGIEDVITSNNISVYPVPSFGNLTVQIDRADADAEVAIEVYDVQSRLVYSNNASIFELAEGKDLDLNGLEAGVYIVRVSAGSNVASKRIVLKK